MDTAPPSTGKSILVVEDDEDTRHVLWLILSEKAQYHLLFVNDAYEALLVARQRKPDLFLIDYHLPGMDGIQLYDHLHAQEGCNAIPALLMSATAGRWQEERHKRQLPGLEKPFSVEELLEALERILADQEQGEVIG